MKLRRIAMIVMILALLCVGMSVQAEKAELGQMQAAFAPVMAKAVALDVITQVYDFGQRANAVRIDLGEGQSFKSADLTPQMFTVHAENKLPDGKVHFSGNRVVTAAYANVDGAYGKPATEGRYIVLELVGPRGRNPDGSVDEAGSETYVKGQKLTLGYTVACGEDARLTQTGVKNLLVDQFAAAEVTDGIKTLKYRYFDPTGAYQTPEKGYPLVLFLHGEDERGTDNELQLITSKGATLWAELGAKNPCYVLAPQIEGEWVEDGIDALVMKLLDEFIADHKVDKGRVYVQGFSMGGTGTWNMVLKHPERFAAAIPMCGYVPDKWYENDARAFEAIQMMPIWTFVVANDDLKLVNGTQKAVATLNKGKDARELTNGIKFELWTANSCMPQHNCWERVYYIGTPYNWLMTQSRERTRDLTVPANLTYTSRKVTDEITSITDYDMDQLYVIDKGDKALLIDSAMGKGNLLEYLREHVLTNKDCDLYAFITHDHNDHYRGLQWFTESKQLKKVYVHQGEAAGTLQLIPAEKIEYIHDGQKVAFGEDELYFTMVSSHTAFGSVMFYRDTFFTGDTFGSGDIFLSASLQEFRRTMQRFIRIMEQYKQEHGYGMLTMYPGHLENKEPFHDDYIYDMLSCIQGAIDGSIVTRPYTRRVTTYATVNLSNISYTPAFAFAAGDETVSALRTVIAMAEAIDANVYTPESYAAFKTAYDKAIVAAKRNVAQWAVANGRSSPFADFTAVIKEKPARDLTDAIRGSLALLVRK